MREDGERMEMQGNHVGDRNEGDWSTCPDNESSRKNMAESS